MDGEIAQWFGLSFQRHIQGSTGHCSLNLVFLLFCFLP